MIARLQIRVFWDFTHNLLVNFFRPFFVNCGVVAKSRAWTSVPAQIPYRSYICPALDQVRGERLPEQMVLYMLPYSQVLQMCT